MTELDKKAATMQNELMKNDVKVVALNFKGAWPPTLNVLVNLEHSGNFKLVKGKVRKIRKSLK